MVTLILVLLVIFWLLGYITVPGVSPHKPVLMIRHEPITIFDILIFFLVLWAIGILPFPLRTIAAVLFITWVLSVTGIIKVKRFPAIVILIIILTLLFSLL